jgi:hypothetical protein
MTIATDLDTWAATVETATGYTVTRDPDTVFPPCLFIDAPDLLGATMPAVSCTVDVWVLADGTGKARLDAALTMLPDVMDATGIRVATWGPIPVGGQEFTGYRLTVPIRITT